jgi:hypothetical protein
MTKKDEGSSDNIFYMIHNQIQALNNSKLFVGLMILTLNISSKFVNLKLSKSMEAYLKYTFSRNIMVFAIAYVGSRDIYIALIVTALFVICMDYLFNEESVFYILPHSFRDYHLGLIETMQTNGAQAGGQMSMGLPAAAAAAGAAPTGAPTVDEINQAIKVLSRIKYNNL